MKKLLTFIKHLAKVILKKETLRFEKNYSSENNPLIFFENLNEEFLVSKNNRKYQTLIAIDGPGFSGSSAVTDLLGEFSNCTSLGGVDLRENPERGSDNCYEVDFFREVNGIYDLERICYTNVGRIRDAAVHNFIKVCLDYYDSGIPFYDDFFLNQAKLFVKNITDFCIKTSETKVTYVPKNLTIDQYRKYAQEFLLSFIRNIPSNKYLILDNLMAISKPDIKTLHDYFGDFKLIYVTCDPRDIYARARLQPGNDWVPVDPVIFVKSWNRVAAKYLHTEDNSLLCVSFDELCNNYELTKLKLIDFLKLDVTKHSQKLSFFNPEISINNTKVWKKLDNQKPIDYIYSELKEYCYE